MTIKLVLGSVYNVKLTNGRSFSAAYAGTENDRYKFVDSSGENVSWHKESELEYVMRSKKKNSTSDQ